MPIVTPTLIPRPPIVPNILPALPQTHPTPLPQRWPGKMNHRRDIIRELDDLSDEENELEDMSMDIRSRGFTYYVPIGKNMTQMEEKNDAESESEDSDSEQSGVNAPSMTHDGEENDSGPDLDASMEDMDEEGNITAETDDPDTMDEGATGDYSEEIEM